MDLPNFGIKSLIEYLSAVNRLRCYASTAAYGSWRERHPEYLEDELRELFLPHLGRLHRPPADRKFQILARYYGLDGAGGGVTYREVAAQFGLTRERVRQICQNLIQRLGTPPVRLPPRLQKALNLIERNVPLEAEALELRLQREGLTRAVFRLEGLSRAAELLGHVPVFDIREKRGKRIAVKRGHK